MANELNQDTNPNMLDIYLLSLREKESSNRYDILHTPSVIPDLETGKPIKVQGLGAYGILDINWDVWAKQAGLKGAKWQDPKAQDAVAKYKVKQYFNQFGSWDLVSIAWFAGPETAKKVAKGYTQGLSKKDINGASVRDYIAAINNIMTEKMMTIKVDTSPDISLEDINYKPPVSRPNQRMQTKQEYAAGLLNSLNKANNLNGQRPDIFATEFNSQTPPQAGSFQAAQIKTDIRRKEQ